MTRLTSLDRTLVDVLHRPDLAGGWEEVWRSLESVEYFDLDSVLEYALLLENATTAAKVGFFLEQHREPLMVEHLPSTAASWTAALNGRSTWIRFAANPAVWSRTGTSSFHTRC